LGEAVRGDGYEIRTVEELPGRKDDQTTMVYGHALNGGGRGVHGPPRPSAESRVPLARFGRARLGPGWRDYADHPVGLELGGKLLHLEEVVRNRAAAAQTRRRCFRVRLTGTGLIYVGINGS